MIRRRSALAIAAQGVVLAFAVSGCLSSEKVNMQNTGDLEFVSTTSGNNLSLVRVNGNDRLICPRLGPDTATDRSGGFAAAMGLKGGGTEGAAGTSSSSEVELQGRTPSILLTRDALFQLCVMHQNGQISQAQYNRMVEKYLDAGFALATVEAQDTQIQIGEAAAPAPIVVTGAPAVRAPEPAAAPAPTAANPL